ncbi:aminotransferase class I/II-fold pyridoxal phosphate-dependent enzyme [Nakamurella silvestris]|nr:aminotransferase class I/II-fold pyridoxal phosphate-dependent enzyme [Nakamurella silvestris]
MAVWAAAARRAEAGLPVFNLSAGQPATPAPGPVRRALADALDTEVLGYTESSGIAPLRERIAQHYLDWYGLTVDPAEVFVTTGSSAAFNLAFLSAFDPGARIGLATPSYPAYRNILHALGCEVVPIPSGPETRYQPTVAMLEDVQRHGPGLDGLIVASPANPSGTMLDEAEMAQIATYSAQQGIRLISDEIYHGITYGHRGTCAWSTDRNGFVINSFSKYFSMTGWRIGWTLVPRDLAGSVDALAGNMAICPPAPAQYAALAAFDAYEECDGHVAQYSRNRTLLLDGLRSIGITDLAPADGAFYVYADISSLTDDSAVWCARLLAETGVAVAPGVDFDLERGHRTMRLSFAGPQSTVEGALEALAGFVRR